MRDLEFLPAWYPRLISGRRRLTMQIWLGLALAGGLGLWTSLADRNIRATQAALGAVSSRVEQADAEARHMDRLEALRRQLRLQADTLDRLGMHIERGRLMAALATALPPDVTLISLSLDTEERPAALSGLQRAGLKDTASQSVERNLRAVVRGVSPSDVELATLLTELTRLGFIENLTPVYARDRRENGRVLREFEVAFSIGLSPRPGEARP